MSQEGIWTWEVYGPFGWDSRGVLVLEDGRAMGGDHRQFATGTYELSGDSFKADLIVHYYGPPRTVYGETKEEYLVKMTGKLKDGVVEGDVGRPDKPMYDLQFHLTKRMDVPSA